MLKFRQLLLIGFLFVSSSTIYAQISDQDSLAYKKAFLYRYKNPDSLFHYSKIMARSKDTCFSLEGKLGIATSYYRMGDYDTSEQIAQELLLNLNERNIPCRTTLLSNTLGRLFWITKNQNRFEEALQYLLEQEKLLKEIPPSDTYRYHFKYARFYTKMGLIEMELGYFENSKSKLFKAFEEFKHIEQLKNPYNNYNKLIIEASASNILGEAYLKSTNGPLDTKLDSAVYYFKKARDISRQFDPVHEGSENYFQLRLASVLIKKSEYMKAIQKIDSFSFNNKQFKTTQDINHLKSIAFYNLEKLDSSFYYADKFLCFSTKTPSADKNRIMVLNIVAEYYKSLKKTDSAFKYSELARQELDTLSKNKSLASYSHYLYDFKKVTDVNDQLISDSDKKNDMLSMALWVLLLLGFGTTYYMYVKRKKLNIQLEETIVSSEEIKQVKHKEYNIKESLEVQVLSFLNNFEKRKMFLNPAISIQELADLAGTNTSYLSSIINKNKQKSFKLYISELRINYLVKVLKSDIRLRSYTVQALAEEVGYTNASAFTRAFKKQIGLTPSEFLKHLKD